MCALTKQNNNTSYDHVGMVIIKHGMPYILEATYTGNKVSAVAQHCAVISLAAVLLTSWCVCPQLRPYDERIRCSRSNEILVRPLALQVSKGVDGGGCRQAAKRECVCSPSSLPHARHCLRPCFMVSLQVGTNREALLRQFVENALQEPVSGATARFLAALAQCFGAARLANVQPSTGRLQLARVCYANQHSQHDHVVVTARPELVVRAYQAMGLVPASFNASLLSPQVPQL